MDVLRRLGEATAAEVVAELPDEPAYDSIRVTLGILRDKGHVTHRREGPRYVHSPVIPHDVATESALRHLVKTYFRGSASRAVLGLLDVEADALSEHDMARIAAWIEAARNADR